MSQAVDSSSLVLSRNLTEVKEQYIGSKNYSKAVRNTCRSGESGCSHPERRAMPAGGRDSAGVIVSRRQDGGTFEFPFLCHISYVNNPLPPHTSEENSIRANLASTKQVTSGDQLVTVCSFLFLLPNYSLATRVSEKTFNIEQVP